MKFLRSIGLAALLMVGASSASAQVYYDMTQMTSQSGYRSEIYETVTTADFLRAPANGVQRLAFTKGSAFAATVYACETKTYAAATCTSVATLSATSPSILVTTGRAWLIVDVTAAETAGNVSYLTIRSHSTQQLSGGSGSTNSFNPEDFGAVANDGLDDTVAFNAALVAASAVKGEVVIPIGVFHFGESNRDITAFYSGIQITNGDVTLRGESQTGSILEPLFGTGGTVIAVCSAFDNTPHYGSGTATNCASADSGVVKLSGITLTNFTLRDSDPKAHVHTYNPATGKEASSREESHGIFVRHTVGLDIHGLIIDSLGDEGIVYEGQHGRVYENTFINTPSLRGSAGSAIELIGDHISFTNNIIRDVINDPQGDGASCTTACVNLGSLISVPTSVLLPNTDILIDGNRMEGIATKYAIVVNGNGAANSRITITNNTVDFLDDGVNCNLNSGVTVFSQCSISTSSVSFPVSDLLVSGNVVNAPMSMTVVAGVGAVNFTNNTINLDASGSALDALTVSGNPLLVQGNTIRNSRDVGIKVVGVDTDNVTESVKIVNNSIIGFGLGATAGKGIGQVGTTCGINTVVPGGILVDGNVLMTTSTNVVYSAINFAVCASTTITNNHIDLAGGTRFADFGITGGDIISNNTVIDPTPTCYNAATGEHGAVYTGNVCINPSGRGFDSSASTDDLTYIGNLIWYRDSIGGVAAIDADGDRSICTGNRSINDASAAIFRFSCGEGGAAAACDADAALGGICENNQAF